MIQNESNWVRVFCFSMVHDEIIIQHFFFCLALYAGCIIGGTNLQYFQGSHLINLLKWFIQKHCFMCCIYEWVSWTNHSHKVINSSIQLICSNIQNHSGINSMICLYEWVKQIRPETNQGNVFLNEKRKSKCPPFAGPGADPNNLWSNHFLNRFVQISSGTHL